jgi:NTP pyrophosphatase (non-canonical NTP hydrolase)
MAMAHEGLAKLIEECGELQQIAGKKLACPDTDTHWDGLGSLKERLENEIADVLAACDFVLDKYKLDRIQVSKRLAAKVSQYREWDRG